MERVEFLQQELLWAVQQGHPPSAVKPVLQKIATLWHQIIGSRGDLHVECASNDCWVGWCMGRVEFLQQELLWAVQQGHPPSAV